MIVTTAEEEHYRETILHCKGTIQQLKEMIKALSDRVESIPDERIRASLIGLISEALDVFCDGKPTWWMRVKRWFK